MEDPLFRRLRLHAKKKLQFEPGCDRAELLAAYKEFYRLENIMNRRYHRKGDGGRRVAYARSCIMDVIIENLFTFAIKSYGIELGAVPCPVSALALGGYGRAELSPYSDIDLMFLYPDKVKNQNFKKLQKALIDDVLYILWDMGFKVGQSTRTTQEAIAEAKSEVKSKSAMLEARYVAGSKPLWSRFEKDYREFYLNDRPEAYIKSRLETQEKRRERYGNTPFLQEPDIKNGVGGLRDYQNVLWMAHIKLGIKSIEELRKRKYIRADEYKDYVTAYDFLLRVRNDLHFQSKRANDVLDLERQPRIAWRLGYRKKDIFERVEVFMRDYYRHAKCIHHISQLLEQRIARRKDSVFTTFVKGYRSRKKRVIDGFALRDDMLSIESPNVFKEDPERLIRVFRHSQQLHAEIDFELGNLINESLPLINGRVIKSPSANRSFRSIMETAGEVYPTLDKMHELEVLDRFVTEFAGLTCLVQHEFYHRYTADIHTLATIQKLDRVFSGESDYARNYKREIHEITEPVLLYIILLLHDIGKATGIAGHAERGVRVARAILDRMQYGSHQKEQILFIINHHLEMARIWQQHDIDDPKVIESFAEFVGDTERLRLLYVHTYCDARGTDEKLWNSYKEMLHNQLFYSTLELLGEPDVVKQRREEKIMISREAIKQRLEEVSDEEIEAHFNLLPDRYFINNSETDVALHLNMVNGLLQQISTADSLGSLVPMVDWKDDMDLSVTVVNVVTWDRPGLFYRLAGAFSLAGLNIISSRAISRADHITIDTFYVCEPDGGLVQRASIKESFEKHLKDVLLHDKDPLPEIREQAEKLANPLYRKKQEILRAPIPSSVDVYHELALKRTIVEIHATDQIGLLYRVARSIFDHGFDITFARISTERGVAVDTFYIERVDHAQTDDSSILEDLKGSLLEIVSPDEEQREMNYA